MSTSSPLRSQSGSQQNFQLDSSDLVPKSPPRPLAPNRPQNGIERNEFRQGLTAQQLAQSLDFDGQPNVQQFVQQNLHNTGFSQQIEAHGGFGLLQNAQQQQQSQQQQINGLPQNPQSALNGGQLASFPHDEGTGQLGLFGAQLSNVPQVPDSQTSHDLQQGSTTSSSGSGSSFAPQSSSVNSLSFDGNGQGSFGQLSFGPMPDEETAPTSLQVCIIE